MDDLFAYALNQFEVRIKPHSPDASSTGSGVGVAVRPSSDMDDTTDSYTRYLRTVWQYVVAEAANGDRPVYIYGAGAHSKWLLSITSDLTVASLRGFLDDEGPSRTLCGYPVTQPDCTRIEDGAIVLISSDRYETQLYERAQNRYGNCATIVRLYEGLPPGPYDRPPPAAQLNRRREATRRARQRWGGSDFVGPYEQAGLVSGFLEEQWLWSHRDRVHGHVLDMSTPKHWHAWIHELPTVSRVSISDLDRDVVMKFGYVSHVNIKADFCSRNLSVAPASFDTILCLSILEHCQEPAQLILNLRTLLAANGILFLTVPFAYIDGHCRPDYWRFARDGLILLARNAGLSHITTGALGDIGQFLSDVLGYDLSAGDQHNGVPLINWLIAGS